MKSTNILNENLIEKRNKVKTPIKKIQLLALTDNKRISLKFIFLLDKERQKIYKNIKK